jgi:hypothetical protein
VVSAASIACGQIEAGISVNVARVVSCSRLFSQLLTMRVEEAKQKKKKFPLAHAPLDFYSQNRSKHRKLAFQL